MSDTLAKMALALGDVEAELRRQQGAAVQPEPSDDFRDIFDDPESEDDDFDYLDDDEDDDSEDD